MRELGFVKLAVAAPQARAADAAYNAAQALAQYREADANNAAAVVFPALCLSGASCGDLFLQQTVLDGVLGALKAVLAGSAELNAVAVLGLPLAYRGAACSCAAVVQRGKLLGVVPLDMPECADNRSFAQAPENGEIDLLGQTVPFGPELLFECEEMPAFCFGVTYGDPWRPAGTDFALARAGASVLLCPAAELELTGRADARKNMLLCRSAQLRAAVALAGAAGDSTTNGAYSGYGLIAEDGELVCARPPFAEGLLYGEIDLARIRFERMLHPEMIPGDVCRRVSFRLGGQDAPLSRHIPTSPFIPEEAAARAVRCEEILNIQAQALKVRMEHIHAAHAVIGISGGLDSCLALIVAVRAAQLMGKDAASVLAVTMPCFGTSERTRKNAEVLCNALGVSFRCVLIGESVALHFRDIGHDGKKQDAAFENAQARERTQVLMDIANMENGLVVGTGDLSELALGWATYNGDHMSMYGVNAGVPKTVVRELVRYTAERSGAQLAKVLLDIVDTPISPELVPMKGGQITEDLVGPYELHDFFLYYFLRWGASPRRIYGLAKHAFAGRYAEETIKKWLTTFCRRFIQQQFKRSCLADGPKVGSVSISPRGDLVMPSDASAALWLAECETL